jgi:hypothetical protein
VATDFEFGLGASAFLVAAAEKYALVASIDGGDATHFVYWYVSSAAYAGGARFTSADGGATWTATGGSDAYFAEYGTSGVFTYPATSVRPTTAIGNGSILDASDVTTIGFEWGTVLGGPYPNSVTEATPPYSPGDISLPLTGLAPSTPHYYRAKIYSTSLGWLYGQEVAFTTLPPIPTVRTDPPTTATLTTIQAVGNITDYGAVQCTERGFVYDLVSQTTPGNVAPGASGYTEAMHEDGTFGNGSFTLLIANLNSGKPYFVRAYARNSYGYDYGDEIKVLCSDTSCALYPNADVSKGIRFDSSPGGGYPRVGGGSIPHYQLVRTKGTAFQFGYGYLGIFTRFKGCYEHHYYNSNMYTDIYGLENPIRRTEGVIKVKWKARLFKNEYPYGEYQRHIVTHGVQYDGVQAYIVTTAAGYDVCELFYTNPFTGLAWTVAELDALQAGISIGDGASFGTPVLDFLEVIACWANAAVTTREPINYTGTTARLAGYVTEDEGEPCQVRFEWGLTTGYGSTTAWQTKSRNSEFTADITGLVAGSTYHCRAVILTPCGETFYGADFQFPSGAILELAFGQSIFTVAPAWTDVSEDLKALHIKRGRMHELGRVEAGTAVFRLDNGDGNWWRNNTAGAFYGSTGDVKPLTLIRLRWNANGIYPVYYGVVESMKPGWESDRGGFTPIMEIGCVDVFKCFTRYKIVTANPLLTEDGNIGDAHVHVANTYGLVEGQSIRIYDNTTGNTQTTTIQHVTPSLNLVLLDDLLTIHVHTSQAAKIKKFPQVLSGRRVQDILLEVGWPLALTAIDAGQVEVMEISPGTSGQNAMEALYDTVESEDGNLFVDRSGLVTFHDSIARTKSPLNTSQATFKDDGTSSKYVLPELVDDDTFIYNEADISGEGIGQQIMIDSDAQAMQGPRALIRSKSLCAKDHNANTQAFVLVQRFKTSALRPQSLLLLPVADVTDLWPKALGYELATRITMQLNSTRNPAIINHPYHIEGVEHDWKASTDLWQTTWQLWEVNKYRSFIAAHDGYLLCYSGDHGNTYIGMQGAAACEYAETDGSNHSPYTDPDELVVGQYTFYSFLGMNGKLWRGYLEMDTSTLAAGDSIVEAYIIVKSKTEKIDATWYLSLVGATGVTAPLVVGDYGDLLAMTTKLATDVLVNGVPGWKVFALNAAGIAAINKGGTTRFGLRSSRDITATDPGVTSDEWAILESLSSLDGKYIARLIVRLA